MCREYLHAWDPLGSYRAKAEDGTGLLIEVVRCTRCTTVRERAIDDVFFEIVGNTYYYADGYPVQGGVGPRSGVRKEYHRRHPPIARDSVMPRNLR